MNVLEKEALVRSKINGLTQALIASYGERDYNKIDYEIQEGRKYLKLVFVDTCGARSVHAFIDKKTGAVYKPASFRAPAKHVRYWLMDDTSYETMLKRADWAGGYLYK